jgi:hypothetical protein
MKAMSLMFSLCFAVDVCAQSPIFVAETGIYGSQERTGEGAFVEVQGDIATVALFSHTLDGDSTFYVGAGPLSTLGRPPAPCCVLSANQGYYPVLYLQADLYKTSGGPVLGRSSSAGVGPYQATKVGRMTVEFGYLGELFFYIAWDQPIPDGVLPNSIFVMRRRSFGIGTFGTSESGGDGCYPDLRGEWVFIDHTIPDSPVLRYDFDELSIESSPEEIMCPESTGSLSVITFKDVSTSAELRCVTGTDPLNSEFKRGCELRVGANAEPLYWFKSNDLSATRMVGSKGAFRLGWARTNETVTALRVPKRSSETLP